MKMVIEHEIVTKMQFCDYAKSVSFFAGVKKFCISLESPHFMTISAKCRKCKISTEMVMKK